METDSPRRKRRWFQFSLRSLLIGVTLLAVPCAYLSWHLHVAMEDEAVVGNLFCFA